MAFEWEWNENNRSVLRAGNRKFLLTPAVCLPYTPNHLHMHYPLHPRVERTSPPVCEVLSRSHGVGQDVCTSISVARESTISMRAAVVRIPVSTAFVVAAE